MKLSLEKIKIIKCLKKLFMVETNGVEKKCKDNFFKNS